MIDVVPPAVPMDNRVFGDVTLLGKSVNGTVGGSLMLGIKKNAWYSHIRYSEQHFGDYHIPTDSIVYLTQRIPIYGRKLKNTAGIERNIGLFTQYQRRAYRANFSVSNVYQRQVSSPERMAYPMRPVWKMMEIAVISNCLIAK